MPGPAARELQEKAGPLPGGSPGFRTGLPREPAQLQPQPIQKRWVVPEPKEKGKGKAKAGMGRHPGSGNRQARRRQKKQGGSRFPPSQGAREKSRWSPRSVKSSKCAGLLPASSASVQPGGSAKVAKEGVRVCQDVRRRNKSRSRMSTPTCPHHPTPRRLRMGGS